MNFSNIRLYILAILFLPSLAACVDDKGNYTYVDEAEVLPIEITGLPKDTSVTKSEQLRLSPEIANLNDPAQYKYQWYAIEELTQGVPKRVEISTSKDLDWQVDLTVGTWILHYQVTDIERNIYRLHSLTLKIVATPVNEGWYILKDDGTQTDLDYITFEGEQYPDVLAQYAEPIPGKARGIDYQNERYTQLISNEDGTTTKLSGQTAFHIWTDSDIRTYNSKDFTLWKTFADHFYAAPATCQPQQFTHIRSGDLFLQNAGKLHVISGMMPHVGIFGAAFIGMYDLYPTHIPFGDRMILAFDKVSHSFLTADAYNDEFFPLADATLQEEVLSFENMPYDVLCIGNSKLPCDSENQSFVLMQHLETGKLKLLQILASRSGEVQSFYDVPDESKLAQTQLICPSFDRNFLYFAIGNQVYSYENAPNMPLPDKEKQILAFEGEEVVALKHAYYFPFGGELESNALAVLTSSNGHWKLRIYNLLGENNPEINPTPVHTFEGTGNARYLMYRQY